MTTDKDSKFDQIRPYLKCLFRCMISMFFSLSVCSGVGLWLGNLFHNRVLFLLFFLATGLILGFYLMYKQINKLDL